jgi:O-antigen/teichoic acid export membrane protein
MVISLSKYKIKLSASQQFMICILFVNAGNYIYNLVLGRWLGPEVFSNVALLVTLLLMLSFLAMTLQLLSAKFIIELPIERINSFKNKLFKFSFGIGIFLTVLCVFFAKNINELFHLNNPSAIYIFALGIPVYFMMSISRGLHQGKQEFTKLSQSYIMEMSGRIIVTFALIGFTNTSPTLAVAVGILVSFIIGLFPNQFSFKRIKTSLEINSDDQRTILKFIIITFLYECTQIIINNSDILIVKHYFNDIESGLYASLALIGRVVYFITWMLIMLLLPKVIEAKKQGDDPKKILLKYLKYIIFITASLVFICFIFPQTIINLLFGKAYISMSPLLCKYAVATSLFALGNLFVYYFLSLSQYKPVITAVFFGIAQLVLLILFHNTLETVVHVQIGLMFTFLSVMLVWFKRNY